MILIRFTAQGANSLIGGFSNGDVARVDPALAKHLVEEAGVAKYVSPHAAVGHVEGTSAHAETAPKRGRKRGSA